MNTSIKNITVQGVVWNTIKELYWLIESQINGDEFEMSRILEVVGQQSERDRDKSITFISK